MSFICFVLISLCVLSIEHLPLIFFFLLFIESQKQYKTLSEGLIVLLFTEYDKLLQQLSKQCGELFTQLEEQPS